MGEREEQIPGDKLPEDWCEDGWSTSTETVSLMYGDEILPKVKALSEGQAHSKDGNESNSKNEPPADPRVNAKHQSTSAKSRSIDNTNNGAPPNDKHRNFEDEWSTRAENGSVVSSDGFTRRVDEANLSQGDESRLELTSLALTKVPQTPTQLETWLHTNERHEKIVYWLRMD